ncbi:protein of unknown function [Thauera humireducens]|nr:protein of unknown function [Thauera humireducens]
MAMAPAGAVVSAAWLELVSTAPPSSMARTRVFNEGMASAPMGVAMQDSRPNAQPGV